MSAKAFGLLAVMAAFAAGSVNPASAEFFGCNESRSKVSYSSSRAYSGHFAQAPAPRQRYASPSNQTHRRVASQWR